jgi:hypothetical protein
MHGSSVSHVGGVGGKNEVSLSTISASPHAAMARLDTIKKHAYIFTMGPFLAQRALVWYTRALFFCACAGVVVAVMGTG